MSRDRVFYVSLVLFLVILSPILYYLFTLPEFEQEISTSNELFIYGVEFTAPEEDMIIFRGFIENPGEESIILYHKSIVGNIQVIDGNGNTIDNAVSYTTGTLDVHVSSEVKAGERHNSEIHTEVRLVENAEKIIVTFNDYAVTRSNQEERVEAGEMVISMNEILNNQ